MQYEIDIDGQLRQVAVTKDGSGAFTVVVDGRTFKVDAARVDPHMWSLILSATTSHEVTIAPIAGTGQLSLSVDGTPVQAAVNSRRRRTGEDGVTHAGSSAQRIHAPMPGKIVRVLVSPGDSVAARQPIVVVEAMKMENELRAARSGSVTEVHVTEGQSVDAGFLLVVLVLDPA